MYEAEILGHFREVPVFSLADASQIIESRLYAKKFLERMIRDGKIARVKRDCYTVHKDPFLLAPFIVSPSYITSVSALSFRGAITQMPKMVFCATSRRDKEIDFGQGIRCRHTNYFFGFAPEKYGEFSLQVATIEKAVIDSIGVVPLSVIEEAFREIGGEALLKQMARIRKGSVLKRIGFLADRNGIDLHRELKKYLNTRHILLDPLAGKKGEKNSKWKVIVNG